MRSISLYALLLISEICSAQQPTAPHEEFPGGNRVAAHYVRLEGSERPDFHWNMIKDMQMKCRGLNINVELPPKDTVLVKLVSDVYYADTHLIEFKEITHTSINSQCKLQVKNHKSIRIAHPFGVCKLNPVNKKATGQCASKYTDRSAKTDFVVVVGEGGVRRAGTDPELGCNKYEWDALTNIYASACIQTTTEPWRALTANGAGVFKGLKLATSTRFGSPTGEINITARATKIEKNISINRELLNIAEFQKYEITEVGGPPR